MEKQASAASAREKELIHSFELDRLRSKVSRLNEDHKKARESRAVSDRSEEVKSLSSQLDKATKEILSLKDAQAKDKRLIEGAEGKSKRFNQRLNMRGENLIKICHVI